MEELDLMEETDPTVSVNGVSQASSSAQLLEKFGEPGGARTRDHRIKSAMLYQLSYRL
jgi:hypothetical protein